MSATSSARWKQLFEAEPDVRWTALTRVKPQGAQTIKALKVLSGQLRVFDGDLIVLGNLVLGRGSQVVVAGDLSVRGHLIGDDHDFTSVAVGGTLRAAALMTAGEVLARKGIQIERAAWLCRNDYIAIAPRLSATVFVQDDHDTRFAKVVVKHHFKQIEADDVEGVGALLGLPGRTSLEQLEHDFRTLLASGKPPRPPKPKRNPDAGKALVEAVTAGSARLLQAALEAGADPNSKRGVEAFVTAASSGRAELVKRLLAAGADPDARYGPWFALHSGANWPDVVAVLLAGNADVTQRGSDGNALHGAWCSARSIRMLLKAGADPDARDSLGRAPLHVIAQSGTVAEVQALVRGGADVHARDTKGVTPLQVAKKRGLPAVTSALLEVGARRSSTSASTRAAPSRHADRRHRRTRGRTVPA